LIGSQAGLVLVAWELLVQRVPAAGEPADVASASFEAGLDARGLPQNWEGSPDRRKLVEGDRRGVERQSALAIAKGGVVSQSVPKNGRLRWRRAAENVDLPVPAPLPQV